MTKTIIDADALKAWINRPGPAIYDGNEWRAILKYNKWLIKTIDKLSTPAPVTQENIKFDDIVDLIEKLKADSFNSINEGKTYFPPQGIKAQEVFEHTLCIFENDFLRYYNDLIKNKSPAPVAQDGDGWCYDMEQIATYLYETDTDDAYVLVCVQGYKTPLPVMYSEIGDSDCKSTYELLAIDIVKDDTITVDKNNFIAWRPLPPIPTRGDL